MFCSYLLRDVTSFEFSNCVVEERSISRVPLCSSKIRMMSHKGQ